MARILRFGTALFAACVPLANPAQGFWWGDACATCAQPCQQPHPTPVASAIDYCKTYTHINQVWPSPYVCPDRVAAHAPFDAMVANGWRRQNLMGSHHFSEDSSKLTQAGELKIQWIMYQAPPEYQRMFVERSIDPEVTKARMATITQYAELIARGAETPTVEETHLVSEGRPAATVDFVNTKFRDNMRVPMLPVVVGDADQ